MKTIWAESWPVITQNVWFDSWVMNSLTYFSWPSYVVLLLLQLICVWKLYFKNVKSMTIYLPPNRSLQDLMIYIHEQDE